jgi:hypothetical protein
MALFLYEASTKRKRSCIVIKRFRERGKNPVKFLCNCLKKTAANDLKKEIKNVAKLFKIHILELEFKIEGLKLDMQKLFPTLTKYLN